MTNIPHDPEVPLADHKSELPNVTPPSQHVNRSLLDRLIAYALAGILVLFIGLMLIPDRDPRMAEKTVQTQLYDLGVDIRNHHDRYKELPSSTRSDDGAPMHSWQTALLPSIGGMSTYDDIIFSEPWDSDSNKEVFRIRVLDYRRPHENFDSERRSSDQIDYGLTSFSANNQVIDFGPGTNFRTIADGLSSTILIGEINEGYPPWGKPGNGRDPRIGLNVTGGFGARQKDTVCFLFADGASKFLNEKIDPKVLEALTTPAGGESAPEEF